MDLRRMAYLAVMTSSLLVGYGDRIHAQETGMLDLGNGEIYYEVTGSGPALVLVHGGAMDRRMWNPQKVLAMHFTMVRYDLRGFGKSSPPEDIFSPTEDLKALLDHLELDRVFLLGSSLGGGIAVDFVLTYPERVVKLVLAEPGVSGHRFSPEVMETMQQVMMAVQRGDSVGAVEAFLGGPALRTARNKPMAHAAIRRMVEDNFAGLFQQRFARLNHLNAVSHLERIEVPTLVLVSEHAGPDAIAIAELLSEQLTEGVRQEVAGSGHMMNLEQPEEFNRLVSEFLLRD